MALCVALLIASEFMPVSLLTPTALVGIVIGGLVASYRHGAEHWADYFSISCLLDQRSLARDWIVDSRERLPPEAAGIRAG